MIPRDFVFTIHVEDELRFDDLINDVAAAVLRQTGYASAAASELLAALHEAVIEGRNAASWCGVQFRAQAGELQVVVSSGAGRVWRVSRPLP